MASNVTKIPIPRQLEENETLDTLTHWKSHVRNYFRQDDRYTLFFLRSTKWDATKTNYGFRGEDAESKAANLESLLDSFTGFMPGPYLTIAITETTKCIDDVVRC